MKHNILMVKKNLNILWKRISHAEFRVEKVIKKEGDKLYIKLKGYMKQFVIQNKTERNKMIVELDLSNYATNLDIKTQ